MKKPQSKGVILLLGLILFLASVSFLKAQSTISLKEIIEKNIQAAGGKEKLMEIKNYLFQAGSVTYYISSDGKVKSVIGKKPVCTEVVIINQDMVMRNRLNTITEITGREKVLNQCLANLWGGFFTLLKFEGQLEFLGIKSFGPEKHYQLTTKMKDLKIDFYVDSKEFTLKRMVFEAHDPELGKYEVNYDFGPYQEVNGIKIPTSWFSSQVGTRGSLTEVSDVTINQPLEKDFFSMLEVNMGEVKISPGSLKGNVLDFNVRPDNLYITTNWTKKCVEEAGFKTNDRLTFLIDGEESELIFYSSSSELPPRSTLPNEAKIMVLDNRLGETYIIYFYSTEFTKIAEKLAPLVPIQVKRK